MHDGQILCDRYKIVRKIGSGSFGDTYIAKDTKFPGEPDRVVKHLCPKDEKPETLKIATRLFQTEAESLAKLGEHDRIPRLFAYFRENKEFFLVQELIEGQDLTYEFQLGKRWDERETVEFLQELLSILSVVHQQDTIHRDIKPANIMRRRSDGKIILIDFGAVKRIATVDRHGETIVSSSTIGIGTIAYMPAEQAIGQPGTYSDIYAVGILGIQALTGLSSEDLPRDAEQFRAVLKEKQITIDPSLESVLCKMIASQPSDRYQNAQQALAALKPTIIIPDPNPPKPEPIPKKLILGVLSAVALLTGAGFLARQIINKPNYAQLETYLEDKEWQKADAETNKLLLKVANEQTTLNTDSMNNVPCQSLAKIDELWTSNSDGRFGFTPQKEAYLETGNEFNDYNQSTYEAFGDRIGWRIFGVWNLYEDLKFNDIAPKGHLPSPGIDVENGKNLRIDERDNLLSRFNACDL